MVEDWIVMKASKHKKPLPQVENEVPSKQETPTTQTDTINLWRLASSSKPLQRKQILQLQRLVGNARVQRILQHPHITTRIQRQSSDSTETYSIGAKYIINQNGILYIKLNEYEIPYSSAKLHGSGVVDVIIGTDSAYTFDSDRKGNLNVYPKGNTGFEGTVHSIMIKYDASKATVADTSNNEPSPASNTSPAADTTVSNTSTDTAGSDNDTANDNSTTKQTDNTGGASGQTSATLDWKDTLKQNLTLTEEDVENIVLEWYNKHKDKHRFSNIQSENSITRLKEWQVKKLWSLIIENEDKGIKEQVKAVDEAYLGVLNTEEAEAKEQLQILVGMEDAVKN